MNGVVVDDIPTIINFHKQSSHSIYFSKQDIQLPLSVHGTTSYLPIHFPTNEEMEFCPSLELTSQDEWDPSHVEDL